MAGAPSALHREAQLKTLQCPLSQLARAMGIVPIAESALARGRLRGRAPGLPFSAPTAHENRRRNNPQMAGDSLDPGRRGRCLRGGALLRE